MSENTIINPEKFTLKSTMDLPVVHSAGGLVCNHHHHILLMFKRGKWDMPKGRIDEGHTKEDSALREVQEETGLNIDKLSIQGKLVSTWHTTRHQNTRYLKKTDWFMMFYDGDDDDLCPQVDEGIIECRWVHLSNLPEYRELIRARVNYVIDFWHENLAYTLRP